MTDQLSEKVQAERFAVRCSKKAFEAYWVCGCPPKHGGVGDFICRIPVKLDTAARGYRWFLEVSFVVKRRSKGDHVQVWTATVTNAFDMQQVGNQYKPLDLPALMDWARMVAALEEAGHPDKHWLADGSPL